MGGTGGGGDGFGNAGKGGGGSTYLHSRISATLSSRAYPISRIVTKDETNPRQFVRKGPGPVGTFTSAHLYANALVVSPYDCPNHTSYGESHCWNWGLSRRL